MIMSVHAVCVLVGFVICLFQNLFVNSHCVFFCYFFIFLTVKRIEVTKNRVKAELEVSVKNVDVKQENWVFFAKILDSKYKEL